MRNADESEGNAEREEAAVGASLLRGGWSTASAIVIAGAVAGTSGAQGTAGGSGLGWWREILHGLTPTDAYEWTGVAGMVIALALIVAAPYFVRSRRRFVGLAGCILLAGVGGYALYDHDYLAVNFALLGNSRELRADCEQMMGDQASKWKFALDYTGQVEPTESMRRLQISRAWVKRETVTLESVRVGNADVVYDPHRTYPKWITKRDLIRSTWFDGFYFFRGVALFK